LLTNSLSYYHFNLANFNPVQTGYFYVNMLTVLQAHLFI